MFGRGENTNLNACVGQNGSPGPEYYSGGYDEAVHILCQAIIKKGVGPDEIIYPILFSARHRVELFLKNQIQYIGNIRKRVGVDTARLIKTHSIEALWSLLSTITSECDTRYAPLIDSMHLYMEQLVQIDDTGETFRYCYSTDHKKHLEGHRLLNIQYFYTEYCKLNESIHKFEILTGYLQEEYATGTFTNSLSRDDLVDISKRLPPRHEWGSEKFETEREEIKQQYRLSSRELSVAFDLIKSNRELAANIGCELPLKEISKEKLLRFLEVRQKVTGIDYGLSMKEIIAKGRSPADYELYNLLVGEFSIDEMAAVLAIASMSGRLFVEHFGRQLDTYRLGETVEGLAGYLNGKSYITPKVIEGLREMRLESYIKFVADSGFDLQAQY